MPEVLATDIGQFMFFQMRPDVLDRIEFRSIGRESVGQNAAIQTADVVAHNPAAMRGQAIPNDQQFTGNRPLQVFKKQHDVGRLDGFGEEFEVEVPEREPSNQRQGCQLKWWNKTGVWPRRSPSAAAMGALTQSTFVDQNDRAAWLAGFFLIPGHAFFFHCSIAAWSRSRARPTGRSETSPVAAESAKHGPHGSAPETPVRSDRRLARRSRAGSDNPAFPANHQFANQLLILFGT